MILGLDISTSITGFSIIENNNLISCEIIDLRSKKLETKFEKASLVKAKFLELKKQYNICDVFIEEPLSRFTPGLSSAQTLLSLSSFNGILSWMIYEIFNIKPQYIACRQARKMVGINVPKGGDAKAITLKHWLDNEPQFKVEYTKFGNAQQGSYDRADSLTIAKAGFLLCQKPK
jgi:hypothetical protein